jgi:hypothetical protein
LDSSPTNRIKIKDKKGSEGVGEDAERIIGNPNIKTYLLTADWKQL